MISTVMGKRVETPTVVKLLMFQFYLLLAMIVSPYVLVAKSQPSFFSYILSQYRAHLAIESVNHALRNYCKNLYLYH